MHTKTSIYLELALIINNQMYEQKHISYELFKITETELLKKLNEVN